MRSLFLAVLAAATTISGALAEPIRNCGYLSELGGAAMVHRNAIGDKDYTYTFFARVTPFTDEAWLSLLGATIEAAYGWEREMSDVGRSDARRRFEQKVLELCTRDNLLP